MKSSRSLRSLLILLLFCAIHVAGFAQNKASISGNVKDSLQKPLAFVTVSLFKQADPVNAIKSTYTNDKGKFSFNQLDTGSYKLIISHTGFSERSESITVSESQNELKDLILSPASKTLAGVSVNARKPLIEQTDDKIIFNAENDPTSKSERAIDLLRKTPFVSVDGDDNILVNGQSNFKVLLNGRETAMFAQNVKEAMKGFPGSLIVKIEVITSPGAKYDGEGVGGVINIITKKKVAGYNGSLNLYAATSGWNNINANFSVKSGKFGFTMFYGAGGTPGVNGKYFSQTIPSIASFYTKRTIMGDRRMINFWQNGNAELSYEIDSLNTLSAYGNINGGTFRTKNNQTITTEFPSDPPTTSLYNLDNKNQFPNISLGTDYIRKFKENKEKEFSIRVNAEIGKSNTFSTSSQDNPGTNDRFINNTSIAQNKQYTIQSDLIQPMKNNQKIEVGVKAILRRATSDFRSLIRYESEIDFKVNPGNTDYFKYDQNVYSIYSTYSFKVKKTTFRLGLRVENTGIDGNFVSSNTKVKQDYTTLLPNIQSTTKLSNTFTLVLSYSKRLQRPFIWNLNPFVNNNDSLNISFGNPGLDPQTINSVSVQTRIMKGPFFAGITFEGNYSGNKILQYSTFDPGTGVTSTTSLNLGKELQFSATGNISMKVNNDWSIFLNGNVRYNRVRNKLNTSQSNHGIGGNANLNSTYTFNKKFNASMYAGFWKGPVSIQTKYPLNIWYGAGVGYKLFNEKLTLSLMASNFFQRYRDYKLITTDPNFTSTSISTMPFRGLALNVSWNFGKLTENVSKKKGVTNDDLLGNGQSSGQ